MVWRARGLGILFQRSRRLFGAGVSTSSSKGRIFLVSSNKVHCSNIDQNSFKRTSQEKETFQPFGFQPYGEAGTGTYGTLLESVHAAANAVKEDVLRTVEPLVTESNDLYSIGDYGTADGASSLKTIGDIISKVRNRSPNRPIQVVYEDQPPNDFNSLFGRLHGKIADHPSYLQSFQNLFTMATATSFFEQCVPDSSMDVILSSIAMHFLSKRPTVLQNTVFSCFDVSQEERRIIGEQAATDWETILLHRAKELKPGGVFIASLIIEDTSVPHFENRISFQDALLCLDDIWRNYRETGKITKEEFLNTNYDACYRTPQEVVAPFESPDTPTRRAGLSLVDFHKVVPKCPFKEEHRNILEKDGIDDRARIARKIVNACRTFTNSTIVNGLNPQRSNKQEVIDSLYNQMVDCLLKKDFDSLKTEVVLGVTIVKKS